MQVSAEIPVRTTTIAIDSSQANEVLSSLRDGRLEVAAVLTI